MTWSVEFRTSSEPAPAPVATPARVRSTHPRCWGCCCSPPVTRPTRSGGRRMAPSTTRRRCGWPSVPARPTRFGQFFGPTNVAFWQIGTEADRGGPEEAVKIAAHTNPAALPAPIRQWAFYLNTARALARVGGRDREAVRYLVTAERAAPQLIHASPLATETARSLRDRTGGADLR